MQTAAELRAIAKANLTTSLADLRAERARAHEKVIAGYLDKMRAPLKKPQPWPQLDEVESPSTRRMAI